MYVTQDREGAPVTKAARAAMQAARAQVRGLLEPPLLWPSAVADDVAVIADDQLRYVGWVHNFATTHDAAGRLSVWNDVDYSTKKEDSQVHRAIEHLRLLLRLGPGGSGCK